MNQIPDTISKMLDALQQRFGATGVHLWQVYIQYIFAEALSAVLGALIAAVIAVILLRWGVKHVEACKYNEDPFGSVVVTISSVIFVIAFFVLFTELPT